MYLVILVVEMLAAVYRKGEGEEDEYHSPETHRGHHAPLHLDHHNSPDEDFRLLSPPRRSWPRPRFSIS